jgi:hypothetical protein
MLSEKALSCYLLECNLIFLGKYILAPQTTTLSPDGPPNYQCLDFGPPNYHFLIFWPYLSIYAVNFKQNSENTLLHFEILTVKGWVFSGFWPISVRINGINRRMRPKNQKVVV